MLNDLVFLILNRDGVNGRQPVSDSVSADVMSCFGVTRSTSDGHVVRELCRLAMSDDLAGYLDGIDTRLSPFTGSSVFEDGASGSSPVSTVSMSDGFRPCALLLQQSLGSSVDGYILKLSQAALSGDAHFAAGAALVACILRRAVLGGIVR